MRTETTSVEKISPLLENVETMKEAFTALKGYRIKSRTLEEIKSYPSDTTPSVRIVDAKREFALVELYGTWQDNEHNPEGLHPYGTTMVYFFDKLIKKS